MVNRDEYRQMLLAGTVSFPATFPQVGRISLNEESLPFLGKQVVSFLSVTENPSARVTLERRVKVESVRAVFMPCDPRNVNYTDGQWLVGDEVLAGLKQLLSSTALLEGIVYVPESAPSILNVSAGMTAGESVQYYPPLPNDPARNHYNAWPASAASVARSLCSSGAPAQTECADRPAEDFDTICREMNEAPVWSCNEYSPGM